MSLHKSLVVSSKSSRKRSVFTRAERMTILLTEGRLADGQSVYNLPKVKTSVKSKAGKKKEKAAEGAAAAPAAKGAPAGKAAAPAAKAPAKK